MSYPLHPGLKTRIAQGPCIGAAWLVLGSAALVEVAARARPDLVVLDLQHGLWERRELEAAIGLAGRDCPVLLRVADHSAQSIGSALDAGAAGVIVPLVESADQAAGAVRASRYPPAGIRSGGGVRPLADFARYVSGADALVTIVMIETRAGVEHAATIAATPGVDMVFIGTGDLALSLGAAAGEPEFEAACQAVQRACAAAGVPCGIFTGTAAGAAARRAQGYRMVVAAIDLEIVARGFDTGCRSLRATPASTA